MRSSNINVITSDGEEIYVSALREYRYVEDDQGDLIEVLDIQTGQITQLRPVEGAAFTELHWSPNGEQIALTVGTLITVMNSDGSGFNRFAEPRGGALTLDWSSDGTRLVFTNYEGNAYTIRPDGTDVQTIARGTDFCPSGTILSASVQP
jgi:Tol biopolymer transport system component